MFSVINSLKMNSLKNYSMVFKDAGNYSRTTRSRT